VQLFFIAMISDELHNEFHTQQKQSIRLSAYLNMLSGTIRDCRLTVCMTVL